MDMLNVYIGLSIIVYFISLLGSARIAIQKGYNGVIIFLGSLVLPIISLLYAIMLRPKQNKNEKKINQFESIVLELSQPFIDLFSTSRAMFGLNLSYTLEGLTYFGVVGLLAIFFNDYVKLDDIRAGNMVGLQTAGITLAMLILGATVDWIGLRKALLIALSFMLVGRIFLSMSPNFGGTGMWSASHIASMVGILGIVLGYGIYQPACYAGVKQLTNEKTAATGYAMLYALMNLGGFLPALVSPPVRKATSILGVYWVYVALTVTGIAVVYFIITKKAMRAAVKEINQETVEESEKENGFKVFIETLKAKYREKKTQAHWYGIICITVLILAIAKELDWININSILKAESGVLKFIIDFNWLYIAVTLLIVLTVLLITDSRFLFFIFILIPVQTLFAHNWLTLPQYTSRAFEGFVQQNFEFFVNLNPIFIFILTPMVAALTSKKNPYSMMIIGTFVMASPTFILALGPSMATLMTYLVIMTIGEAMWQPRFLQWVAEIAPKNMTGIYMGIGQFPWFLTKVITSLYSGWFLMNYCPMNTPASQMNTETMWLVYGGIAILSPIGLFVAKNWMMKGFKTKHEG
jgi:proton-dependent oligopeptide transporter, POT family